MAYKTRNGGQIIAAESLLGYAVEAFVETDQRYLQHDSGSNRDDGCTAVAAVLVENQLLWQM